MRRLILAGAAVMFLPLAAGAAPILLDNFNEAKKDNALGGATGTWFDPEDKSVFCNADYDDKVFFGAAGRSLRLDYKIDSQRENVKVPTNYSVSNPATKDNQAFNGYYSLFPPQDLTNYTHLIFWVKGDADKGFTRSFKIELKDGQNTAYAGYRVTGITDQWRRYAVPLREFRDIKDWANVKELVFVFAQGDVTRKDGTLYLDDFYFSETAEQNISIPEESYAAARGAQAPAVDGAINDWPRKRWRDISDSEYVEKGARSGKADASARWAVRWDAQYLYVAVALKDNEVVNREIGDGLWKDDCVEIYVSPNGREFAWGDPSAFQLGFAPTSSAGNPARWAWFQRRAPTDKETQVVWNKKGNVMEAAIAWSFLGVTPGVNRDMGFAVAFHDRDLLDGTPECKLTWSIGSVGTARVKVGRLVLQ
ncbi:MAG: hypothetical protein IPP35_06720 [Elusimicrobia bacterium]|nr:hypothetical protein [Elusimicrobiota bacterium]